MRQSSGEHDSLHALRGGGADQGFHGAGVAAAIRHADHGGCGGGAEKSIVHANTSSEKRKAKSAAIFAQDPPGPNGIRLFSKSLRGDPEGQRLSGLRGAGMLQGKHPKEPCRPKEAWGGKALEPFQIVLFEGFYYLM